MKVIDTQNAPRAIGPYSQAIVFGQTVYCSGSIPLNPESMKVEVQEIELQTEQVLKNMSAVLEASGSSLGKVLKTTVYLKSMDDFQAMNTVYAKAFQGHAPARTTIQVAKLPLDVLVEIECIASL